MNLRTANKRRRRILAREAWFSSMRRQLRVGLAEANRVAKERGYQVDPRITAAALQPAPISI